MQGQLPGSRPQIELVAVAVAAMAKVAADRHVHRERATTMVLRQGLMQRTTAVPLRSRSLRGLESNQAQDLLHRDLGANSVEIYARHDCFSLDDATARRQEDRSVPFLFMGNGNDPPRTISSGVANRRACGKAGQPVPATPAPRPTARS